MKSIASHDDEYLYVNGWGFPQNQPGRQIPTISFEEGLAKYDKNKDGKITPDEMTEERTFKALDLNKDGSVTREEADQALKQMAERSKQKKQAQP
jgi:Ca2+-binding EF-hand superfamily protein